MVDLASLFEYKPPPDWQPNPDLYPNMPQVLKNVPAGVLSNFLVGGKQSGVAGYVPDIAAQGYVLANLVSKGVQNLAMYPTKYFSPGTWDKFTSYDLPGADTAARIIQEDTDKAREYLGIAPPNPADKNEVLSADIGLGLGSAGIPLFGAGNTAVNTLPRAAQRIVKPAVNLVSPVSTMGPTGSVALPAAGGVISGGVSAAANTLEEQQVADMQVQLNPPAAAPTAAPQPVSVEGFAPVAPQALTAPQPAPTPAADMQPVPLDGFAPIVPDEKIASLTGTTYGDAALATAGALALAAGVKSGIGLMRQRHVRDFEALSREAAQYQAAERAGVATGEVVTPPLPGVEVTDRIVARTLDNSVILGRVAEATAPNPARGAESRAQLNNLANEAAHTARFQAFADTGFDPATGKRYYAFGDHARNLEALPEAVRMKYSELVALRDELDNRSRTRIPHNFPEKSYAQLTNEINSGMLDPVMQQLITERKLYTDGMTQWLVDRGMLTQAEAAKLRARHPNYLPNANELGQVDNPLTARDLTPFGGESRPTLTAWEADKQHIDALFRAVENNEIQRSLINQIEGFQARNPRGAKLVEVMRLHGLPISGSTNAAKDVLSVSFRDNGVLKHYRIRSPELYRAFDGIGQRLYIPVISESRQLKQAGTTGPLGWLVGGIGPAAISTMNGSVATITRRKGTAFGLVDAAVNKATKGKLGVNFDPTGVLLGQPYAIGADTMSLLAKGIADMLKPGQRNKISAAIRNVLGDQAADFISNSLYRRYHASTLHERRALGATGSAGMSSVEVPSRGKTAEGLVVSGNRLNHMYPDLFIPKHLTLGKVRLPMGNSMPFVVKVNELAKEVHQLIAEAHASHYYRLNKAMGTRLSPAQLVHETRRLTGDVGEIGSSKGAQAAVQAIPYATPIAQGARRYLSNLVEHPFATAGGTLGFVILAQLAAVFTAMLHGQDTLDHLTNEMTPDRIGATVPLYLGPNPDTDRVSLSVESALRGPMALGQSFVHDFFRLMYDSGEEGQQAALTAMSEIFKKHISTTQADNILTGATNPFSPSLPPAADALLKSAGSTLPNDWVKRAITGENPFMQTGTKRSIPGIVDNVDPITGGTINKQIFGVLEAFTGALGSGAETIYNSTINRFSATKDPWEALAAAGDAWKQNAADRMNMSGILWGRAMPVSQRVAFVEQAEAKMRALQETVGAKSGAMMDGSVTRKRGELIAPGQQMTDKLPTDPAMRQLFMVVADYNRLMTKIAQPAMDTKKQIDAMRSSGLLPQDQRVKVNELTRTYQERMATVANSLNVIEQQLSLRLGKQVVLENIDWHKGMEQFKDLPLQ